jgi:hypothetical protein
MGRRREVRGGGWAGGEGGGRPALEPAGGWVRVVGAVPAAGGRRYRLHLRVGRQSGRWGGGRGRCDRWRWGSVGGGARGRASGEGVVGLAAARARSWWRCAAAVRAAAAGAAAASTACRAPDRPFFSGRSKIRESVISGRRLSHATFDALAATRVRPYLISAALPHLLRSCTVVRAHRGIRRSRAHTCAHIAARARLPT